MATLILDDGMETDAFSASWALRIRVSMSAIGSLIAILYLLLPTGLDNTRDLAIEGKLADLVTAQTKFTENATRTTGQLATVAQARGTGIARHGLQFQTGVITLLLGKAYVIDGRIQCGALLCILRDQLAALFFTVDQSKFCHDCLNS